MTVTTIKVPRGLRDRLAERAASQGTTLAGAIESALDASDEQHFWDAVRAEHATLSADDRSVYLRAGGTDDLSDGADDELSERGGW
ncbi:hypothetical protein [Microbacterium sp.]|uniref:hypothetical protein n=1 Tax=Microbacterium sp. TaxID=51671 RepID=UPI0039E5957F